MLMSNSNSTKPEFKDMNFYHWQKLLKKAIKVENKVRLYQDPQSGVSFDFDGIISIPISAPIVKENDFERLIAKYPLNIIIGEFVMGFTRQEYDETLIRFVYDFLMGNVKKDRVGDWYVDVQGAHYHIDTELNMIIQTVHDTAKAVRDGSIEKPLSDKEALVSFEEFCPHCNCESHSDLDLRIGLAAKCSSCGEVILACSMCDDGGSRCHDCPEESARITLLTQKAVS